jgi:hypothetical protein
MKIKLPLICAFVVSQVLVAADAEITQNHAQEVANYYLARYFPEIGCGGARRPTLRGEYWESAVAIGEDAKPSGTIRVHRFTGTVSYQGPLGHRPSASAESLDRWASKGNATRKP